MTRPWTTRLVEREQQRALVRTFLARFFENEITQGTDDLKASFFWLLSFLAMPGFLVPLTMAFGWDLLAQMKGPEALRIATRGDKAFYLGFAMIASAGLSAITWNSLLPDRRDGLILGAMPVRAETIVSSKLAGLAMYITLIAAGMHALASVSWGFFLASANTVFFALRGIGAHFVAAFGASVFVFLLVAAVQGLTLAATGPRLFARLSPALQIGLVGAIVSGLLALPTLDVSVVDTLRGSGDNLRPWLLMTPPLWFLGLYEWGLGTSDPTLLHLARTAAVALVAAGAVTAGVYPIAYRRVMVAVVEGEEVSTHGRSTTFLAELMTAASGRSANVRAVSQFFLATIGRVERQRFVLAVAIGVAAAWGLPGWISLMSRAPKVPRLDLLSLPLAMMTFLLVGIRTAASVPSDVRASWLFDVNPPRAGSGRQMMERTMFVLGVTPMVALSAALYWHFWGARVAVIHATIMAATGALVTQALLWRFHGVPCTRPWNPESLELRSRWYLYFAAFLLLTAGIAQLESALFARPVAALIFAAGILVAAIVVRMRARRQPPLPPDDLHALSVGDVLSLN